MTDTHTAECSICLEDTSSYISCGCKSSFCHPCARQSLISTTADPHCPSCRKGWNREFLYDTLGSGFINTAYKDHRRTVLLETQNALLPQTMLFISQQTQQQQFRLRLTRLRDELNKLINQLKHHNNTQEKKIAHITKQLQKLPYPSTEFDELRRTLDNEKAVLRKINNDTYTANTKKHELQNEYRHHYRTQYTEQPTEEPVAPKILCSCPYSDCRGFIMSSNYKCGLCNKKICKDCREPLEAEHKCDPNTIETVKLLKTDTKPCPKCATPINKLDGCDQMWCPQCKVAFSWKKGIIETGVVHNPHYYEYMRRTGQHLQRNPLDIPRPVAVQGQCQPNTVEQANRTLRNIITMNYRYFNEDTNKYFENILAHYNHILERQQSYTTRIEKMGQQEDLRIKYLKQEITQQQLAETLIRRDKMREKCLVIRDVIELVSSVATEAICGLNHNKFREIIQIAIHNLRNDTDYDQQIRKQLIPHPTNTNLVLYNIDIHDLHGRGAYNFIIENNIRYVNVNTPIKYTPTRCQIKLQQKVNVEQVRIFNELYCRQMDTVCDYANEQFIKISRNYEMKCPFIVSSNYVPLKLSLYSHKELIILHSYNIIYRLDENHLDYIFKDTFEDLLKINTSIIKRTIKTVEETKE